MRKAIVIFILLLAIVGVVFGVGLAQAGNCGGGKGGGNSQTCPPRSPAGQRPPPCTLGLVLNNMTICIIPGM
jgi:hypothetical protein